MAKRLATWLGQRKQTTSVADRHPDAFVGADAAIRASAQDRLRRVDFADRIATVLSALTLEEGRVFAIRGGWGFGKSSLKHLIIERLKAADHGADWLDFNPWQWGDGDAIARAMFGEIANALGGTYSADASRRAEKLRRYGAILTGAAEPLDKAGGKSQLISSVLTSASVVAIASAVGFSLPTVAMIAAGTAAVAAILPMVGKGLAYLGRDRTSEPLDRIRLWLENSLRSLKKPLVIFVDDIDRLEPEQIRLLLRQVKANANLPNLVFVLIYQPSIVEAALDPIAANEGKAFLEKVVQANFDLPALPAATVHRIFTEELSSLASAHATEENGFQQVRWGNCLIGCIQPYVRNLRDARRLLSSISVHMPLHAGTGAFEVNILDFLILETLRVFEPELHHLLFRERELVLQSHRYRGDGRNEIDMPRIKALVDVANATDRKVVENVLKELFPQMTWAFENRSFGSDWQSSWLAEKRVCTARFFPRYFELQTPEGELSESEATAVLTASSDPDAFAAAVSEIVGRNLLAALAQRMDESVDRLPVSNAAILLPAMFAIGQKLAVTRTADPFNSPWVSAWRAVSWFLKNIPASERGNLAVEALKSSGALSMGTIIIHLNDPDDAKDNEHDNFDPALDVDSVDAMKAEWLRQMAVLAADPEAMLAHGDLTSLLYRWREYTHTPDLPARWVREVVTTDARFAVLIDRLMSRGRSSSWGDRVSAPYDSFNKEIVEELIGLEAARERAIAIDIEELSQDQAHAIHTLLLFLDGWRDGKARP